MLDTSGAERERLGVAADTLSLVLPVQRPDVAIPVIELFLRE